MYKKLTIICANSHFNVVFLTEIIILFVHLQACCTLLFCIGNALVTNSYSIFFLYHSRKLRHWLKPLPQNRVLVWKPHCYFINQV